MWSRDPPTAFCWFSTGAALPMPASETLLPAAPESKSPRLSVESACLALFIMESASIESCRPADVSRGGSLRLRCALKFESLCQAEQVARMQSFTTVHTGLLGHNHCMVRVIVSELDMSTKPVGQAIACCISPAAICICTMRHLSNAFGQAILATSI